MSLETRKMIARVAQATNLLVIEDGLNNLLEEKPMPPIASFAPDHIVYISSLSKTVAAGLRTAFIHVPERFRQSLVTTLYSMNIAISPLLATVSAGLIEEGIADEIIAERKKMIVKRNLIVNEVLGEYAVASELTCPLRFIRLPEHFTGKSFEICAEKTGVRVYGAERFAIGNKPAPKAIRIAVTTPTSIDDLSEGVQRLRELLEK